jgi:hypothetical protein
VNLRRFASELFSAGANAVLLLPPMPEYVAAEAIRSLSRKLPDSSAHVKDLLRAVSAVRESVEEAVYVNRASQRDLDSIEDEITHLTLGVCLFARTINQVVK